LVSIWHLFSSHQNAISAELLKGMVAGAGFTQGPTVNTWV